MTPDAAIAALDRQIARHGQTVTLERLVVNGPAITATFKAFVRGYKPDELAGGIQQGDSSVVISPSSLKGTPFEAALPAPNNKVSTAGRRRNVQTAEPVLIGDTVVRINLLVRG